MNNNNSYQGNHRGETSDMYLEIKDAAWESIEVFEKLIGEYRKKSREMNTETEWDKIYKGLKDKHNSPWSHVDSYITNETIMKNLGVGKSTVERFKSRCPAKRSQFIMLCILYKVSLEDTNTLLKRIGFDDLFCRDVDDCIYTYMIINNDDSDLVYKRFENIKKDIICRISETEHMAATDIDTAVVLHKKLNDSVSSYDSFCDFVCYFKKALDFENAKVIRNIKNRINEKDLNAVDFRNSTFKHQYDRVVENKATVNREFLILLGIHLGYNADEINAMLTDLGYLKLFSKDMLESCLCYVLEFIDLVCNKYYDSRERTDTELMRDKIIEDNLDRYGYAHVVSCMLEDLFDREEIKKLFSKDIETVRTQMFVDKLRNK
ncbi:MAG: hypothetical protein IKJ69_04135 [Clostridia bacterium]|nr:hypothetical protein [Clostridia bacterium]